MNYTKNPELDAARHDDEADAHDAFMQKAQVEAPKIVLKQLQKIEKPSEWFFDKFHGGHSADSILNDAMADEEVSNAFSEYMVTAEPEARLLLLNAMAVSFAKTYAYEIYKEYCDDLTA